LAVVRTDVSEELFLRRMLLLLVTANIILSSQILVTLTMEEISFSETLVLKRATLRNISEDDILYDCTSSKYHRSRNFLK
jgi:hypothetical protein